MPFGFLFPHRLPQSHVAAGAGEFESAAVHKKRGDDFASQGQWKEALAQYSLALREPGSQQEEGALRLSRGHAFASLSERLRQIPAAQSEAHALNYLDPTHLAQLALTDSLRARSLQPQLAECHLLQGTAYLLLERYAEAEVVLLEGISLDPLHIGLQSALRQAAGPTSMTRNDSPSSPRRGNIGRVEEVECTLCMKLLFEPVTTSCGHTFCRPCFLRAQDHGSRCPMCRTVLHVGRELPVTVTLKSILEKAFPLEYAQRQAEEQADMGAQPEGQPEAPVPLFVMSPLMPGQKMELNIFEPRYRLMVRRCMEGNRRFGMATVSFRHQLNPVACLAEITDCQPIHDGRFYLEIVGRRRFHIEEAWEQDGYRIARPAYFEDAACSSADEQQALIDLALHVEALADQWTERLRALAQAGSRDRAVLHLLGLAADKPPFRPSFGTAAGPSMPEAVSFWVAGILPLESSKCLHLLEMTSTQERLQLVQGILQRHQAQGCAMQ